LLYRHSIIVGLVVISISHHYRRQPPFTSMTLVYTVELVDWFSRADLLKTHNEPAISPNYTSMTMTQYKYQTKPFIILVVLRRSV